MIIGNKNTLIDVTMKMEGSSFKFVLTGSRYFKTVHSNSDWDYFAQDSEEVKTFLKDVGFKKDPEAKYYQDDLTVAVYQHSGANIHVQLVTDVELKEFVQSTTRIELNDISHRVSKVDMHHVWNALYKLGKICMKEGK